MSARWPDEFPLQALLLRARWRHETDRFGQKEIVQSFKDASNTIVGCVGSMLLPPCLAWANLHLPLQVGKSVLLSGPILRQPSRASGQYTSSVSTYPLSIKDHPHFSNYRNATYTYNTCRYFGAALMSGSKYIFQTMPRLLTLWLDTGEDPDLLRLEKSGGQT